MTISWPHLLALALLIWKEARGSSRLAQVAVAHSVLNRVARPSWWGGDLLSVIWKKWQYSSMTAPGDPQLHLEPKVSDPSWAAALEVAHAVLYGGEPCPFPGADSYYDGSMRTPPKWATDDAYCGQVASPHANTLRFYNVDHDYERT